MPKLSINTTANYSPNFDLRKRNSKQIKYIIFHYTGMKNENDAIKKLTSFISYIYNSRGLVIDKLHIDVISEDLISIDLDLIF